MELEQAIAVIKKAGLRLATKQVKLKRREVARINELLTIGQKVVVSHNGRRATVFTQHGYKNRVAAAKRGNEAKNGKDAEQAKEG